MAFSAGRGARFSRGLVLSLILLPAAVQTVIMLVNGSIGTGIAVMGAFSLVRFRSVPGSAREIISLFLCMAVGLATATGYLGIAVVFTLVVCAVLLLAERVRPAPAGARELKITVPESLNYVHAFDDVFDKYTAAHTLLSARTTNMGSLYRLHYRLTMKDPDGERAMIDELRCRNGNLEIMLGTAADETGAVL